MPNDPIIPRPIVGYRRRCPLVLACRWDPLYPDSMTEFLHYRGARWALDPGVDWIVVETTDWRRFVYPGQWVAHEDGRLTCYTAAEFADEFEEIYL